MNAYELVTYVEKTYGVPDITLPKVGSVPELFIYLKCDEPFFVKALNDSAHAVVKMSEIRPLWNYRELLTPHKYLESYLAHGATDVECPRYKAILRYASNEADKVLLDLI